MFRASHFIRKLQSSKQIFRCLQSLTIKRTYAQASTVNPTKKIVMKIIPAPMEPCRDYGERNALKNRQLSPHLSIYKVQLTSAMSILLRITGAILCLEVWALGLTGLFCDCTLSDWVDRAEKNGVNDLLVSFTKFSIAMPFAYHFVSGTRHIIWHFNVFLSKPEIYITGYVAIALSLILAGALMMLPLTEEEKKEIVDLTEPQKKKKK